MRRDEEARGTGKADAARRLNVNRGRRPPVACLFPCSRRRFSCSSVPPPAVQHVLLQQQLIAGGFPLHDDRRAEVDRKKRT